MKVRAPFATLIGGSTVLPLVMILVRDMRTGVAVIAHVLLDKPLRTRTKV